MKKRALTAIGTTMMILNLSAFANKTEVVIYSPHAKPMLEQLEKKFETVNPDIDIVIMPMGGSEALNRIKAEANNPIANVYYGSPTTFFSELKKNNLLVKFEPEWAKKISDSDKDKDGYFSAPMITPMTIAMMKDSKLPEPKSWMDLDKKEYRDKIITFGASSSSIATFLGFIASQEGMSENDKLTSKAEKWFAGYDENIIERTEGAIVQDKLTRKLDGVEMSVLVIPTIETYKAQGAEIKSVMDLKEGIIGITDHIAIVKGTEKDSKKLEAAKKFVEFAGSEESQIFLADSFNRMPTLGSAKQATTKEWMKSPMKFANIDWEKISTYSSKWLEKIYNEIF